MPSALSEFPAYLWKYCIHCGISATLYSSVDFISMHLLNCFLCACAWLCPKIVPVCHMNSSVLDCCTAPYSTQLSRSSINMIRAPVAALFSWSAWTICKVIRADQVLCIQLLLETLAIVLKKYCTSIKECGFKSFPFLDVPCLVLFITVTSSRERNVVCPRKRRWPESPPVKLNPSP